MDEKSRRLLTPQSGPQHVERKQRIVHQELAEDAESPEKPEKIPEKDHYSIIQEKVQQVKGLAKITENQLAARLKDYKVEPEVTNELLDAEERLFGTRTGVITYQMYRVCLEIVGKQSEDFAGKVTITSDSILEAVGGNLENAFAPEGISRFMKSNDLLKNGKSDFSKYAPINMPDMDDVVEKGIKKLWDMIVDIALPKPLKRLIGK